MKKLFTILFILILSAPAFALTRQQLESRLRELIPDELTNQAHPDSVLDSLINTALATVTSACSCKTIKDTTSAITVVNVKEYNLPSDFENIKSLFNPRRQKKALTQIVSEDIGQFDIQIRADSMPPYFYIEGKKGAKKIGFDYTPVKVDTFHIWYYPTAKILTHDTMTTDLPEAFDNAILYYTLSLVFFRDTEDSRGLQFLALTESEMTKAKMKFKPPDRVVAPKIISQ